MSSQVKVGIAGAGSIALSTAARKMPVPVADSQLSVNTAASASSARSAPGGTSATGAARGGLQAIYRQIASR